MNGFRFRWQRRPDWGHEAYDAFEGEFRVAQVLHDPGASGKAENPYRWMVSCFVMKGRSEPMGAAATPRDAAIAAEAAFAENLPNIHGFHMRTERAIELCRRLGIALPPQTRWQAEKFKISVDGSSAATTPDEP